MRLFFKECGQVMRGVLYIVYVGAIVLFFATQFMGDAGSDIEDFENPGAAETAFDVVSHGNNPLIAPQPGQEDYGSDPAEIPEQVMPNTLNTLLREYSSNRYATHPIGFIRVVRLNAQQQAEVDGIIRQVTGLSGEELTRKVNEWAEAHTVPFGDGGMMVDPDADPSEVIPIITDYDSFKQLMAELDGMLGGGSSYRPEGFASMGQKPLTYEQAVERYENFLYRDKITGAYARLFSDYMGIAVAIFAVFVPVGFLMRDRRAGMQELVFSRRVSSARLILTRYAACMVAILLPLIVLGAIPTVQLLSFAAGQGLSADPFAFLWYILGWIGPTALTACSVGFFFTTLTGTPVGIAVQFFWSFFALMSSVYSLAGYYGAGLILRHNQSGGWHIMNENWSALLANRLGYTALALVLLLASILFYELQRRGRLDIPGALSKIFHRRARPVPADAAA